MSLASQNMGETSLTFTQNQSNSDINTSFGAVKILCFTHVVPVEDAPSQRKQDW